MSSAASPAADAPALDLRPAPGAAPAVASATESANASAVMSTARTLPPSAARRATVARPMPDAAPVTTATRSVKRSSPTAGQRIAQN